MKLKVSIALNLVLASAALVSFAQNLRWRIQPAVPDRYFPLQEIAFDLAGEVGTAIPTPKLAIRHLKFEYRPQPLNLALLAK